MGKKQVFSIAGGILCFLAAQWMSGAEDMGNNGYLSRNSYGEGDAVYELAVEGIGSEAFPLAVTLGERLYRKEEVHAVFKEVMSVIEREILGENQSLDQVRSDLNLITGLSGYGVRIRWTSDDPDRLDSFGRIVSEELPEKGAKVWLTADLAAGEYEESYELAVTLYPPLLSEQESAASGLKKLISGLDRDYQTEEGLPLPMEYKGKKLHYRSQEESNNEVLLLFGIVLAALFYARDKQEGERKKKKRSRQLMADYAEIVFKLMVFTGAGMTVYTAWERMTLDYEGRLERGKIKPRAGYEEMYVSYQQIRSGIAEGQAYKEFGRRCELQPYLKLSSLLEQNRKAGTKNLRLMLETEMASAWEQRKTMAKRLGEEAGTKLLLPLFLMLGIVMVVIMVPAMLSMT